MNNEWIDLNIEKPQQGERCLLYGDTLGICSVVAYLNKKNKFVDSTGDLIIYQKHITHWFKLPNPPKIPIP